MNKVILMGRLTRDPEVRYSQGENGSAVARFSLAVDRRFKRAGDAEADFFNCTAFGRQAEFVAGNEDGCDRQNPERQLHEQRWPEGLQRADHR